MHDGAAQSDEALLTAIAAGDRSAFAAFFQRYAGKVKPEFRASFGLGK